MSPTTNKDEEGVEDEGFHSPSITRPELRGADKAANDSDERISESSSDVDNDCPSQTAKPSPPPPPPQASPTPPHPTTDPPAAASSGSSETQEAMAPSRAERRPLEEQKAETLAEFILCSVTGKSNENARDGVEETLLRCVRKMMQKHQILLKGMMNRLEITSETGYVAFVAVADELFEGTKKVVTWARIVALYAFAAQLALYSQEKGMQDLASRIPNFVGQYCAGAVVPFVKEAGGWSKLCEEFPGEEDLENKAWKFLTWTAIGLGLAATATFFTSH